MLRRPVLIRWSIVFIFFCLVYFLNVISFVSWTKEKKADSLSSIKLHNNNNNNDNYHTKENTVYIQSGRDFNVNNNNNNVKNNTKDKNKEFSTSQSQKKLNPVLKNSDSSRFLDCDDIQHAKRRLAQRGKYWVFYNFLQASKNFKCDESITYTTHSDYTYLDNLIPLAERWQGPISISIYCPGIDYYETVKRIKYFRQCVETSLIEELVTFHLFFDSVLVPQKILMNRNNSEFESDLDSDSEFDCSSVDFSKTMTFKKQRKLTYPVNVARNIAREMANTFYVLPSDVELWPSPNLIPKFFQMIKRADIEELGRPNPKVFVLPIFEVEDYVKKLPEDKTALIKMLHNRTAVPFHKYVCSHCHRFPGQEKWTKMKKKIKYTSTTPDPNVIDEDEYYFYDDDSDEENDDDKGLGIFQIGKRQGDFRHWEPIFIGTKHDPVYDERLSYEGIKDKMTQGYALCVMDYDFLILDKAFLIHHPGIKRIPNNYKNSGDEVKKIRKNQKLQIVKRIIPELRRLYGTRQGCAV